MIDLYINTRDRTAFYDPYHGRQIGALDLSAGDTQGFNLFFCDPTRFPAAPLAIRRYAGATVSMQLLDPGNTAQATQGTWTELINNSASIVTISIASPGIVAFVGPFSESI